MYPESIAEKGVRVGKVSHKLCLFEGVSKGDLRLFNTGFKVNCVSSLYLDEQLWVLFNASCEGREQGIKTNKHIYNSYLGLLKYNLTTQDKHAPFVFIPLETELKQLQLLNDKKLAFIDTTNNFNLGLLKEDKVNYGSYKPLLTINADGDHISCFQLIKLKEDDCFKLFLGTTSGCVLIYLIEKTSFHIIKRLNHNSNFYVSSLSAYSFDKPPTLTSPFFISLSTLDGFIKVFKDSSEQPLFEFVSLKKSFLSLQWDINPTMIFFLDQNDQKVLNALSFNKNSTNSDYIKKMYRSPVKINNYALDTGRDHFACVCDDGTIRVGKVKVSL